MGEGTGCRVPRRPLPYGALFMCTTDEQYMRRALELAARARGRTSPNPMVGCVAVSNGRVLAEAYHAQAGAPHAEIAAIDAAREPVAGATLYVTLEPCNHTGRTPPCTERIIAERPARVVVAMEDPNPLVSGKGVAALREAGIAVDVGVLESEARRLNEAYAKYITEKTPFVIAKCAMTLDGKIATRTGDSRWVTGEESRAFVHRIRDQTDAILVGSRTVMTDNPSLTARLPESGGYDPVRVLVDADDYLDASHRVFHLDSSAPTWVVVPAGRTFEGGAAVIEVPPGPGGVDMVQLMRELAAREIVSVLIEGGGATLASAFEARIVDKLMFFIAPKIIGGREAVTAVEGAGVERMDEAVQLERMSANPVGEDILIEAYVRKG